MTAPDTGPTPEEEPQPTETDVEQPDEGESAMPQSTEDTPT